MRNCCPSNLYDGERVKVRGRLDSASSHGIGYGNTGTVEKKEHLHSDILRYDQVWLFPHVDTAYTIFSIRYYIKPNHTGIRYIASFYILNGKLPCVDFTDVIMGDIPEAHSAG